MEETRGFMNGFNLESDIDRDAFKHFTKSLIRELVVTVKQLEERLGKDGEPMYPYGLETEVERNAFKHYVEDSFLWLRNQCEKLGKQQARIEENAPQEKNHAGDCTIYASLAENLPENGVCTCGLARRKLRAGYDKSFMYSVELLASLEKRGLLYRCQ